MEAPMCKICENRHYAREPHIFGKVTVDKEHHEKVLKTSRKALGLTNTNANEGKAPKGGERTARRSADSSGSRITAAESRAGMRPSRPEAIDPAGGMPAKNRLDARMLGESLSPGSICQPVVRGGKARTTGSCRESQTAGIASIATRAQRTARGGLTAARGGKNTRQSSPASGDESLRSGQAGEGSARIPIGQPVKPKATKRTLKAGRKK